MAFTLILVLAISGCSELRDLAATEPDTVASSGSATAGEANSTPNTFAPIVEPDSGDATSGSLPFTDSVEVELSTPDNLSAFFTYAVPGGWTARPNELSYETTDYDIEIVENAGAGRVRIVLGGPPSSSIADPNKLAPWTTVTEVLTYVGQWESAEEEPLEATIAESVGVSYATPSFGDNGNSIKYQLIYSTDPSNPLRLLVIGEPSENDGLETVGQIIESMSRAG